MTDALGWRAKFGVLAPSTNTIVEPDFYHMSVPRVTAHFSRIHIRNQNLSDDAAFEALLGQVRQEIGYAVERVMTAEPDYMVMGMSSETFWGGVEGNRQFIQQIKALSGGLGVATGAEACERALHRFGARRLGVVTPSNRLAMRTWCAFLTRLVLMWSRSKACVVQRRCLLPTSRKLRCGRR